MFKIALALFFSFRVDILNVTAEWQIMICFRRGESEQKYPNKQSANVRLMLGHTPFNLYNAEIFVSKPLFSSLTLYTLINVFIADSMHFN